MDETQDDAAAFEAWRQALATDEAFLAAATRLVDDDRSAEVDGRAALQQRLDDLRRRNRTR